MFQVIELDCVEQLRTFQLAWNELASRGRSRRFQLSSRWLETYWKHAPKDRELKVLAINLAGRTVGIMPLIVKKSESTLGTLRLVTYPLDGWGSWYGPIGPNSAATLTASMRYLYDNPSGWDLLDLSYTDRDRIDLGRTQTAARNIGWGSLERHWQKVHYIQCQESWDLFLNEKNENSLQQIGAAQARINTTGSVQLKHYRSSTGSFSQLEQNLNSWQEIAPDADDLPLIQDMAEAAEAADSLDLAVLHLDNKPVAATLGFIYPQGVEIVKSVCIKEETQSLETVLLGHLLEQSHLLGDQSIEISPGCSLSNSTKKTWATHLLNSYRYTSSPISHLRGSLLLKYHKATTGRVSQHRKSIPQSEKRELTPTLENSQPALQTPAHSTERMSEQTPEPTLKIYG